jgi:hypothetical protein
MVMSRAIADYEGSDPAFAAHLKVLQIWHRHVNDHLRSRLEQIYKLPGYSGPPHVAASSASPTPSTISPTALKTGVEDCVDGGHIDNKDEQHNDKDDDKVLWMADTLIMIMG